MFRELKRATLNYRFLFVIILFISLYAVSSYFAVWKSALSAKTALDLDNTGKEIILAITANKYNIWTQSFKITRILFPMLCVLPYIFSYANERENNFRFLMLSRMGKKKYLLHKFNSICLSGALSVLLSELLFSILLSIFSRNVILQPFDFGVTVLQDIFNKNPEQYIIMTAMLHFVFFYSFCSFAIGVNSFFNNKPTLLIMPFIGFLLYDLIFTIISKENLTISSAYSFMHANNYSLVSYLITCLSIFVVGILLTVSSERRRYIYG